MTTENWELIQDLFFQAISLPAEALRDYIQTLDQYPNDVRQEVINLIEADHKTGKTTLPIQKHISTLSKELVLPEIKGYELQNLIAHGGMGSVYKAWDMRLSRYIAIKVLHPHLSTQAKFKQRFLREARAAARLQHDNINTIYDIAETGNGLIYITSAFCEGVNMADKNRQHLLTFDHILSYMLQLVSALITAHSQGVIHRDLKPENIIVDNNNNIKLVDFGIAKIHDEYQTSTGDIIGTPAYMSPEQFRGEAIDAATDIWAAGIILYELIEGKTPYEGKPAAEIIYSMLHEPVDYPNHQSATYQLLYSIIQKCLQIDKSLRPASADILHELITRAQTQLNRDVALQATAEYDFAAKTANHSSHISISTQKNVLVLHLVSKQKPLNNKGIEEAAMIARKYRGQLIETDNQQPRNRQILTASFGYPLADENTIKNGLLCGFSWLEHFADGNTRILASYQQIKDSSRTTQQSTLPIPASDAELTRSIINFDQPGVWITESLMKVLPEGLVQVDGEIEPSADTSCFRIQQLPYSMIDKLSPFTGRSSQLAVLQENWHQAREGDQQRILLSGEAGIGKSRLIREFKNTLNQQEPVFFIELACSPYEQSSTYYPIIRYLKDQITSTTELNQNAIQTYLQIIIENESIDDLLLCKLLGVAIDDQALTRLPSGDLLNRKYQSLLTRILTSKPDGHTTLLIIEDLHWIDQATSLIVERLLRPSSTHSALILLSCRPEYKPPWLSNLITSNLYLSKLRLSQSETLLTQLINTANSADTTAVPQPIDAALLTNLAERTGGNPLFIEELAKSVSRYPDTRNSDTISIPDSIQSTLTARIEKLGSASELAQIASVIGRYFDIDLLTHCSGVTRNDFRQLFNTLIQAGLIYSTTEEKVWHFKHALIRDAAYQMIMPESRKELHAHIASTMENTQQDTVSSQPELLAQHWENAENRVKAVHYWCNAAQRNLQISAISECIDLCQHALTLAEMISDSALKNQHKLTIYMILGPALMNRHGYADEKVMQAYSNALALCQQNTSPEQLIPILFGLWTYHCVRSEHQTAYKLSQQMIAFSDPADHAEHICESYMLQGINDYYRGEFTQAQSDLNRAYAHYEPEKAQLHIIKYGQDPAVVINNYRAWNELVLGNFPESMTYCVEALRHARELNHPFTLVYALSFATWTHLNLQQHEEAQKLITESIDICREQEITVFLGLSLAMQALLYFTTDNAEMGQKTMQQANEIYLPTGALLFIPSFMTTQAEVLIKNGKLEQADELLDQAINTMENSQELWAMAPALALKIMIATINQNEKQANLYLQRLIKTLDHQKAKGIKIMLQQKGLDLPD